jgi:hypothetical protein
VSEQEVSEPPTMLGQRLEHWFRQPQPILRMELVRICAPLAILGFMAARVEYADEWLGDTGFRVPDLGTADYRQPLFIPSLPAWAAWIVAILLVASGLCVAAGFRPRRAAVLFAFTTAFVALSDRLAAFSVSKLAPMIAITIALSPCGARFSVDAWLRRRALQKNPPLPTEVISGSVRFLQVLLPVIYCASGIAKCRGDWLTHSHVLWTHLHDSYQTAFTVFVANTLPASGWTVFQGLTLVFETFAPLWFAFRPTRTPALIVGVGMHTMIGLMFGPVRYFAMLMATLLIASYMPARYLERLATAGRGLVLRL